MIIHYHKIFNVCLFDQEKQLAVGKKTINVIPVWKWLLT
jgi:hypothetical protein